VDDDCRYRRIVEFPAQHAREISEALLAEALPVRWRHVEQVAARAGHVAGALNSTTLEAAAWLHDVGYAPSIAILGFHPLDGARYLQDVRAPTGIASLVAYHSAAESEAAVLGLQHELSAFDDERTTVRDLLWYLDMTTGPDGTTVSFERRMAEVRERYPSDHYVIQALDLGMPERVAAVERAETWLESVGLAGQV
jgi:hypothetical protein